MATVANILHNCAQQSMDCVLHKTLFMTIIIRNGIVAGPTVDQPFWTHCKQVAVSYPGQQTRVDQTGLTPATAGADEVATNTVRGPCSLLCNNVMLNQLLSTCVHLIVWMQQALDYHTSRNVVQRISFQHLAAE